MSGYKLGDKVLVAAVLRRRYEFDRGPRTYERPYGKVWKRGPAKRLRGIIVGKRTLSDGVSDGARETWRRYIETRRYSAYIVAFNLSARHEYVLEEDLLPDTEGNEVAAEVLRALTDMNTHRRHAINAIDDVPDAEIVEGPDVPF